MIQEDLGALLLGIYGLHGEHMGAKVLVTLIDTRFGNDLTKAIIGTIEVDMHVNHELVYMIPKNYRVSLSDFCNHVMITIKTKGYESMTVGEVNLILIKAVTAGLSNYAGPNFKVQTDHIAEFLGPKGIRAIPGKDFDPNLLYQEDSTISIPKTETTKVPTKAVSYMRRNSLSIRFRDYESRPQIE
jgi:hypothetical protein